MVRHGETDYNRHQMLQGHIDVPLNRNGEIQAEKAAETLKGITFERVYASPLLRAEATARILMRYSPQSELVIDHRLIELSYGNMEGKRLEALPSSVRSLFEHPEQYIPPEGGESIMELKERCRFFLEDLQKFLSALPDQSSILIVSHGAAIRGLISCITEGSISDFWKPQVGNCAVIWAGYLHGQLFLKSEEAGC